VDARVVARRVGRVGRVRARVSCASTRVDVDAGARKRDRSVANTPGEGFARRSFLRRASRVVTREVVKRVA